MSFTDVLNLSISASWLVLAVMAARLVLKKAPKALHCGLWALVAVRLLCPLSIESAMSLVPSREVVPHDYLVMEPREPEYREPARLEIVTNPVYEDRVTVEIEPTVDRVQHWDLVGTILWVAGMGAMGIYAAYSYLSLRLRVRMAARLRGNIFECDEIDSPFILGLLRPRIYLPSALDEQTRENVLAHENAHLKRLDHLWKPLGFTLLTVHWFNPVMWLGYTLLCRDIELACDEKVIKKLDRAAVRAYSEALVRCSVPHRSIVLCPLAFGEVGVKGRIRAMTRYKKPGLILTVIALVVAVIIGVCFLTDPAEPEKVELNTYSLDSLLDRELYLTEVVYSHRDKGLPYSRDNAPVYTLSKDDAGEVHLTSEIQSALYNTFGVLGRLATSELSADDFSSHVYGEDKLHELLKGENAVFWQLESDSALSGLHHMLVLPEEGGIYLAALEKESNVLRDLYRLSPSGDAPVTGSMLGTYLLDQSEYAPYFQLFEDGFVLTQFPRENGKVRGDYELSGGTLILRAEDRRVWTFHTDEFGQMVFDALRSDELLVRTDYDDRYLVDGAAFHLAYSGDPDWSVSLTGLGPGEKAVSELFTVHHEGDDVTLTSSYVSFFPELTVGLEDRHGNQVIQSETGNQLQVHYTCIKAGQYRVYAINNSPDRTIDWGTVRFTNSDHACNVLGSEIRDQEDHNIYESGLDKAILRAIQDQNRTELADQRICVAEFKLLDKTELCIDGDPGAIVTTVFLLPRYQEYSTANNVLRLEYDFCTPTILELTQSGGTYTLTDCWTPRAGGNYDSDIAERFTPKAKESLKWTEDSARKNLDRFCREKAQLRLDAGDLPQPEAVATIRSYRLAGLDSLTGPSFALSTDGTFIFSENPLTSYRAFGVYTISDYELVLRSNDGLHSWVFTPEGNDFLYKAEESDIITYYPDLKDSVRLPDGARFTEESSYGVGTDHLDDAISQAILDHYEPTVKGSTRIQAYEILDTQTVCGVAAAGGDGGNRELMVVCALTRYEEHTRDSILAQQTIPAVLTFEITAEGYQLLSYETPRPGDHYQADLEKLLTKASLARLKKEEYDLIWKLADDCAYHQTALSITLQQKEQEALENKLEELVTAICASPAQSSNPGDYVAAHPAEFAQAREAGLDALGWCFGQFAKGDQIGLRGHVMALLCQSIILDCGEGCQTEGYLTGQDWFDAFADEARVLREELGDGVLLYEQYTCHAMAMETLGILD